MSHQIFDKWAGEYDRTRRQLIPCFDAFYQSAVEQLSFPSKAPIEILDIGAGTGLLSSMVRARFPNARLTLQDSSGEMLAVARSRFEELGNQVTYIHKDYRCNLPPGPFNAVVSALSIHHLTEPEKLDLFVDIAKVLDVNGIFVNADQVLGETPEQESDFRASWLQEVRTAGISQGDLAAAQERMKADKMSKLSWQLDCLRQLGYKQVVTAFQADSFVVYSGVKE
jgi:tRNA (cmo5U34)-methyltransferase